LPKPHLAVVPLNRFDRASRGYPAMPASTRSMASAARRQQGWFLFGGFSSCENLYTKGRALQRLSARPHPIRETFRLDAGFSGGLFAGRSFRPRLRRFAEIRLRRRRGNHPKDQGNHRRASL